MTRSPRPWGAIPGGPPILLYQGAFREDQGIEELLVALRAKALRDTSLVTVFLGFGRLESRLREVAASDPGRIVVLPPVPSGELLEWTAGATFSFVGAPPKTINLRLTIPNKLFESLMAGVRSSCRAAPRLRRWPARRTSGTVVTAMVPGSARGGTFGGPGGIRAVQTARRLAGRTAALERYNAETEQAGVVEVYRRLAGPS